jgi:hypothetical protein
VGGGWQPFCISPETAGWGRKCEKGALSWWCSQVCSPKFGATSSHVFTQSPPNVAVEHGIHSLAYSERCFALPHLLYRWRHQSGIFCIPLRKQTTSC